MGDTSPKNLHKLDEQKHEEHVKKEHDTQENAERQHHHAAKVLSAEEIAAQEKQDAEAVKPGTALG